jgi:pyruvate/2-oxoglutarate/acetoin dehydrogenase E1 component
LPNRLLTQLAKDGVEAEIIDPRTIKPLDIETIIEICKKTNRCVVVDEAHPFGGLAAETGFLIQREAFDYLDAPVQRVTLPDVSAPFSKPLFDLWLPDAKQVIEAVNAVTIETKRFAADKKMFQSPGNPIGEGSEKFTFAFCRFTYYC